MPESPEVEELASFLNERTRGLRVRSFDVMLPKALKSPVAGVEEIVGSTVTGVTRHAKMIDLAMTTDAGAPRHVIVHFGHDGWALWHDSSPEGRSRVGEATLMARLRFGSDAAPGAGVDLTDAGQWKSLTVHIVPRPDEVPAVAKLGPDPLAGEVDTATFAALLAGRRKQIKALLQDQTALAGIGNAYSDEILHAARVSPVAHAANLTSDEVGRLYAATVQVLSAARDARRGVAPADLKAAKHAALTVHRKAGRACPVCGDEIRTFTFSGAAAQYCATCQTAGESLG